MKKNAHIILAALSFSIILWGSVSLSNDYYATINVPIKLTNFQEGYTTGTNLPKSVSVRVKGKGWKLIALTLGAESDYIITAQKDSGRQTVYLSNYLVDNQWLSSGAEVIDIIPDTLSFVVEKISSKKVKIIPNLNLNFKAGYGLATRIKVEPESTILYGPISLLTKMENFKTEDLTLTDLDNKNSNFVELKSKQGISYPQSKVKITLDVQKIVDKNFNNISVEVVDMPRDRIVVLLPNKINISVRGGIDILAKLDQKKFEAFVNYRDVVLDTLGSIVPQIILPENTKLLFTKPERLRYIIKKYN